MIAWLLVPVAILILLVILLLVVASKGTLHFGPAGYISGKSVPPRFITLEQYGVVVSTLIKGQPFDFLWVTAIDDEMRGLTLLETDGRVELSVNFLTPADADKRQLLADTMAGLGCNVSEEDKESVTFHLPNDDALVIRMSLQALYALQDTQPSGLYITASNIAKDRGMGFRFEPARDLLDGIV